MNVLGNALKQLASSLMQIPPDLDTTPEKNRELKKTLNWVLQWIRDLYVEDEEKPTIPHIAPQARFTVGTQKEPAPYTEVDSSPALTPGTVLPHGETSVKVISENGSADVIAKSFLVEFAEMRGIELLNEDGTPYLQ